MAKTCLMVKASRPPKFKVRAVQPLPAVRPAARVLPRFRMCRLCLRDLARKGQIPGLTKASW